MIGHRHDTYRKGRNGGGQDDALGVIALLDGGADCDTAVYAGASSSYAISFDQQTGHYSINGTSQGEGIDTLFVTGGFLLAASASFIIVMPSPSYASAGKSRRALHQSLEMDYMLKDVPFITAATHIASAAPATTCCLCR